MLLLGLILLVVGLILALAPTGLRPPAVTVGWILVAVGAVLILVALVDDNELDSAVALPALAGVHLRSLFDRARRITRS